MQLHSHDWCLPPGYLQAVVTGEENGTIILWDLTRGVVA